MLSVVQCVNGNFSIVSEHSNSQAALVAFHDRCKVLWNAPDVIKGVVKILDEQLDMFQGKSEFITHEVETPEEETIVEE